MSQRVISGNKPSTVTINESHAIVSIENNCQIPNINSKSQYTKNQVEGAEEPTINELYNCYTNVQVVDIFE